MQNRIQTRHGSLFFSVPPQDDVNLETGFYIYKENGRWVVMVAKVSKVSEVTMAVSKTYPIITPWLAYFDSFENENQFAQRIQVNPSLQQPLLELLGSIVLPNVCLWEAAALIELKQSHPADRTQIVGRVPENSALQCQNYFIEGEASATVHQIRYIGKNELEEVLHVDKHIFTQISIQRNVREYMIQRSIREYILREQDKAWAYRKASIEAQTKYNELYQSCKEYNAHLAEKINTLSIGFDGSDYKDENGNLDPAKIAADSFVKLENEPLYVTCQKKMLVEKMLELTDPAKLGREDDKELSDLLKNKHNQDLLATHTDSTEKKLLIALLTLVTGILPGLVFLGLRSKFFTTKNSFCFWKADGEEFQQNCSQKLEAIHDLRVRSIN